MVGRIWREKTAGWLGALVVFGLSALLAFMSPLAGLTKVDNNTIRLFEPSAVNLPLQPEAAERVEPLTRRGSFGWDTTIQFHLPNQSAQTLPKAILIGAAGGPTNLYLNGINIAQARKQALPSPMRGGFWLAQTIDPQYLNSGENRIDMVMGPDAWHRGLPDIRTGTPSQIEAAAARLYAHTQLISILTAIAGIIGLLISPVVYLVTRSLLASVGGAIVGSVLIYLSATGLGFMGTQGPQMIGGLIPWVLIGASVIAAAGYRLLEGPTGSLWAGLAISSALASALSLETSVAYWALPQVLALYDVAPVVLTGFGMPMLVIVGTMKLVRQRGEAEAEANRQALVVARQADEIQRQAQSLAIIEERKRFSRDIHDGIGGQLVSLLWRVRAEEVPTDELAGELERGLADLRLVVDALDDGPLSLSDAMWNFAARARQQLQTANIAFSWHIPETLDVDWHDSRRILSLYRILQEATTNVVRHANARALKIEFAAQPSLGHGGLRVVIEDNGVGIKPETRRSGRGLTNLSSRTEQLGGSLTICEPAIGNGTRIEILLPPEEKVLSDVSG
jgi:signal transduction histidine kinase